MLLISLSQQPINVYMTLNLDRLRLKIRLIVKAYCTRRRCGIEHNRAEHVSLSLVAHFLNTAKQHASCSCKRLGAAPCLGHRILDKGVLCSTLISKLE